MVGPDITFLYPYDVVIQNMDDICGVNLRWWYYWRCEHFGRYYRFISYLNRIIPGFEKVYPLAKWKPDKAIKIIKNSFDELLPLPLYSGRKRKTDSGVLGRYFQEVNDSFMPAAYQNCRYIVGMRLHSTIFACQMGIPFISLSYQPKNDEFCRSIGMDRFSVDIFGLNVLKDRIIEMKERAVEIREHLIETREEQVRKAEEVMREISHMML